MFGSFRCTWNRIKTKRISDDFTSRVNIAIYNVKRKFMKQMYYCNCICNPGTYFNK